MSKHDPSTYINLLKLKSFLKSGNSNIKHVIIAVAYHSFIGTSSGANAGEAIHNEAWAQEKESRYGFLRYLEEQPGFEFRMQLLLKEWVLPTKETLFVLLKYVIGDTHWSSALPFLGGYQRSYSSMLTKEMLDVSKEEFVKWDGKTFNDASFAYLTQMISQNKEAGIQTHLVFFPVHPDYQAAIPPLFEQRLKARLKELAESSDGQLHDFTRYALEPNLFQDHAHLNALGSDVFTPFLFDKMAK